MLGQCPRDAAALGADGAADVQPAGTLGGGGQAEPGEQPGRGLAVAGVEGAGEAGLGVPGDELVDAALGDEAPTVDDRGPVTHQPHLGQQV